jgi:hypothetical protein
MKVIAEDIGKGCTPTCGEGCRRLENEVERVQTMIRKAQGEDEKRCAQGVETDKRNASCT